MDSLKVPVILLVLVLAVGFFLFNPFSSKPGEFTKRTDPDRTKQGSEAPEATPEKVKQLFKNKRFQAVINNLQNQENSDDYEVQKMLGYSYAAIKDFDRAIVAFEKAMDRRRVPEDGYSLAYLYEITGRTRVARLLYEDLSSAKLPPKMLRGVYEGLSRTSIFENDTKAAIKYNLTMVKRYPDSVEGFMALLKLMRITGHVKGLEKLVKLGDKHHKNNFPYNFWLGLLYFETGNFDAALNRFQRCIKLDKDNSTPYYYTYRILKRKKNISQALEHMEEYHKLNPLLPHIFFEAAIDARNEGKLDLAYKFLRSAYTRDRTLLGRNDQGTMRAIEKMIKRQGSRLDKMFLTAFMNYINGDYTVARRQINQILPKLNSKNLKEDARRILRECDKIENQDRQYKSYLARMAEQQRLAQQDDSKPVKIINEFEGESEADLIMRKAMVNPNDLRMQYSAGIQLARLGKLEDAERFFRNALRINPNILEPNYSMAKLLKFKKQNRRAREFINKALHINPNNSQALSMSASLYLEERDFSQAASDAQGALKANPNNGEARLVLAKLATYKNNYQEALKEINAGLKIEKDPERKEELIRLKNNLPR
ncbi:MAG: tetratricopeptide repeat protein [Candidatus Rifleibacteriota bacterium]